MENINVFRRAPRWIVTVLQTMVTPDSSSSKSNHNDASVQCVTGRAQHKDWRRWKSLKAKLFNVNVTTTSCSSQLILCASSLWDTFDRHHRDDINIHTLVENKVKYVISLFPLQLWCEPIRVDFSPTPCVNVIKCNHSQRLRSSGLKTYRGPKVNEKVF